MKNWNLRDVALVAGATLALLIALAYSAQKAIEAGWL